MALTGKPVETHIDIQPLVKSTDPTSSSFLEIHGADVDVSTSDGGDAPAGNALAVPSVVHT